ncbi:hypothetical protein HC928_04110 [bacterium]|nr:hypothetical protein [bacterium]
MVTLDATGQLAFQAIPSGSGGGLTSVGITPPSELLVTNNPLTANGLIGISWATQTANRFFASPNGATGIPAFRAIVFSDLSSVVGTTSNTLAAGNDSRFHSQNTDTGTTQATFMLESAAASTIRLRNNAGVLSIRNKADTALADLSAQNVTIAGNLTVSGTTTTVNTAQLNIADNIITLNSDFTTGVPTENTGIGALRGGSPSAQVIWDEVLKAWLIGIVGAMQRVSTVAERTFVAADLVAGKLTWVHNQGVRFFPIVVADQNGFGIGYPDDIRYIDVNTLEIDLTNFTIVGTWTVARG